MGPPERSIEAVQNATSHREQVHCLGGTVATLVGGRLCRSVSRCRFCSDS